MSVAPRPADDGPSSPAGGKWQDLTPELGGVLPTAAPIDGCTPHACIYVCLNSCLSDAVQVCRTTPGRPGGEFPSRRRVASSHTRGQRVLFSNTARIDGCMHFAFIYMCAFNLA